MAFAFLNNLPQQAGNISEGFGSLGNLLSAIRGFKRQKVQAEPMPESERYALSILKALANPQSSLVKEQTDIESQQGMADLLRTIRAQTLSERRERSLGRRGTFFDPERRDEIIAYQLSRGLPTIQRDARLRVLDRLRGIAGDVGGYAGAQSDRYRNYRSALGQEDLRLGEAREKFPQDLQKGLEGLNNLIGVFKDLRRPRSEDLLNRQAGSTPGYSIQRH